VTGAHIGGSLGRQPGMWAAVSVQVREQSAHCRSRLTSSDSRSAWCPGRRVRCLPWAWILGGWPARCPQLASTAPSASRSAPATSWCTREGDTPAAAARVRIEIPSARAETSAGVRSRTALQPPRGPGDPGQDPPLPPARLDPLVDHHPPNRASRVQAAGHHGGAGGSLPAPPCGPSCRLTAGDLPGLTLCGVVKIVTLRRAPATSPHSLRRPGSPSWA